tara:strand:+ start:3674 stop:3850 length:177 start_codon:yes stop_codon:yes gene_type:complete
MNTFFLRWNAVIHPMMVATVGVMVAVIPRPIKMSNAQVKTVNICNANHASHPQKKKSI